MTEYHDTDEEAAAAVRYVVNIQQWERVTQQPYCVACEEFGLGDSTNLPLFDPTSPLTAKSRFSDVRICSECGIAEAGLSMLLTMFPQRALWALVRLLRYGMNDGCAR